MERGAWNAPKGEHLAADRVRLSMIGRDEVHMWNVGREVAIRRTFALVLLLAPALLAGQPPLTVERIFSEPPLDGALPREVHWLPDDAT